MKGAAASAFDTVSPNTGFLFDRKAISANSMTTTPRMVSDAPKKRRKLVRFSIVQFIDFSSSGAREVKLNSDSVFTAVNPCLAPSATK